MNMDARLDCQDSVVREVITKFMSRAEVGLRKYGVSMDRSDLSVEQWIEHAIEEHMDAIVYLQKLQQMLSTRGECCAYDCHGADVNDDGLQLGGYGGEEIGDGESNRCDEKECLQEEAYGA